MRIGPSLESAYVFTDGEFIDGSEGGAVPIKMSEPLAWRNTADADEIELLEQCQPNMLAGHPRAFISLLFLRFGETAENLAEARDFLKGLVTGADPLIKSARQQLQERDAFAASGAPGTPYVGLGLTARGYRLVPDAAVPTDAAFQRGMRSAETRSKLADPALEELEPGWRGVDDIDAVVIVADPDQVTMLRRRADVRSLLPGSATVVVEEKGRDQRNAVGEGIEHFGYVDGRSQPLFLVEDIEAERAQRDGATVWDPTSSLDRLLVPDPAAPDPDRHFGSYFVFRKLEQNVRAFKQGELDFAGSLGLDDPERAGAMLVGRFEDGTPLATFSGDGARTPVPNDFDYDSDRGGTKCPYFAHIRKTNPRGQGGAEPPEDERKHLMARRGQTYGTRDDDPSDSTVPPSGRPEGGVGLLFMAFNADVVDQFEFTQAVWANNPGFPFQPPPAAPFTALVPPPGLDPVIGQGPRTDHPVQAAWCGEPATSAVVPSTPQAVTLKGGDYFFAPSRAFLAALA